MYWRLLKGNKTRRTTPTIDNTNVYNYFESLYVPQYDIDVVDDDVINGEMDIMYEELNQPFTVGEVITVIKGLKKSKSPGDDLLSIIK